MVKDPQVEEAEENIVMKKSEFDDFMARLKRVEAAADKSHLASYDDKNREEIGKKVNLRTLGGKIITGWSDMDKNIVEKNANGAWYEDQVTTVLFEDKTEVKMDYVQFARHYQHVPATVVSETKEGKDLFFKVQVEDGKIITINSKFVN